MGLHPAPAQPAGSIEFSLTMAKTPTGRLRAAKMTPDQITKAQRMPREWLKPQLADEKVRTAAADARAAHETAKAERTISKFSALAEERAKPWWRRIVG